MKALVDHTPAAGIRVITIGHNLARKHCSDFDGVDPEYSTGVRAGPPRR